MRVLVLTQAVAPDAALDEIDVEVQAEAVVRALEHRGHVASRARCDLDLTALERELERGAPDVVFNLVEALAGRERLAQLVPALLQALGIPFTGCGSRAMLDTAHKPSQKRRLVAAGLPTPAWIEPSGRGFPPDIDEHPPRAFVFKAAAEHGSIDLDDTAVVTCAPERARALLAQRSAASSREHLAEAYIDGREFAVGLLAGPGAPELLPTTEISFDAFPPDRPRIVGYAAKWHEQSFEYTATPRRFLAPGTEPELVAELASLSLACWRLFELSGYARVDFRVDRARRPWILEVNPNPCLSPDAGFAAMLEHAGIGFDAGCERILADAFESRSPEARP